MIGVGSLPITSMVGLFSGIVMALQMTRALTTYGAESRVGEIVSITLVREMGPVLTALLVAGRNASGIRKRARVHEGHGTNRRDARSWDRPVAETRHATTDRLPLRWCPC